MRPTIKLAHRSVTRHARTMRGPRGAVLKLATQINAQLAQGYADFLAECEAYQNGTHPECRSPRRLSSGAWLKRQGYRPHYCEHGTNQWVDYDNICGPCEGGVTMGDPTQRMTYALELAHARLKRVAQVEATYKLLRDLNVTITPEQIKALNRAALAALDVDAPF